MIAVAHSEGFIPFGSSHMDYHPGNVLSNVRTQNNEEHEQPKKFWHLRSRPCTTTDSHGEQELYVEDCVTIWSEGTESDNRRVIKSYTVARPIVGVTWCTFPPTLFNQDDTDNPCICVLDSIDLNVFPEKDSNYIIHLPFFVHSMWSTKVGLLFQRKVREFTNVTEPEESTSAGDSRTYSITNTTSLPTVFSLIDPLEEITPVITKQFKGGTCYQINYFSDPSSEIIFTSEEPDLCVTYRKTTKLHTVWSVRRATAMESNEICNIPDISSSQSFFDTSNNSLNHSMDIQFSSPQLGGSRFNTPRSPKSEARSFSMCHSATSSPLHSTAQPTNNSYGTPPYSLLSRFSAYPSPNTSNHSSWTVSDIRSPVPRDVGAMTAMWNDGESSIDDAVVAGPLFPDVCLDFLWHETKSGGGDFCSSKADKVFLTTDLIGQNYLCFLMAGISQLRLVRYTESNTSKLIFTVISTISSVIDSAPMKSLQMLLVLECNNSVILYSGPMRMGKVHLQVPTNTLSLLHQQLMSPAPVCNNENTTLQTPRRSSLLPTSRLSMEIPLFEESPIISEINSGHHMNGNLALHSFSDTSTIQGLRDPANNRVTLDYGKDGLVRITLSPFAVSPLVSYCLAAVKQVFPPDVALHVFIRWYCKRNVPGSQEITLNIEWQCFLVLLLGMMGYDVDKLEIIKNFNDESINTSFTEVKKVKTVEDGCDEDWQCVLNSEQHTRTVSDHCHLLHLNSPPIVMESSEISSEETFVRKIDNKAPLFTYIPYVLFTLHLLYEDLKLNTLVKDNLCHLSTFLHQLASDLNLHLYVDHYWRDFPLLCMLDFTSERHMLSTDFDKIRFPPSFTVEPPNVFSHIYQTLRRNAIITYPYIPNVNKKSKDITMIISTMFQPSSSLSSDDMRSYELNNTNEELDNWMHLNNVQQSSRVAERVVLHMCQLGLKKKDLVTLPPCICLWLQESMLECQSCVPMDWPQAAYELIGREDQGKQDKDVFNVPFPENLNKDITENQISHTAGDGMDGMDYKIFRMRFPKDQRVIEVRRLLESAHPMQINVVQRPETSDHDYVEEKERHLYALCTRTMALSVGRGMFSLHTVNPLVTEPLAIPPLCLTGKSPPRCTTVELSHIEVMPNMNLWPLFHNGVAAGLRISQTATHVDSSWIVYNKPKGNNNEVPTEHAGFLLALGLSGHLQNLTTINLHNYLSKCQEMTSIGLLLGISAAKRGTMDIHTTKALGIHIEPLLPPTSAELDITHNVQVAALLGVGLVYEKTGNRHVAEILLSEIGRPPGPEMENSIDRESYSLAAGLALGLVIMGYGGKASGLDDLAISHSLCHYMLGGKRHTLSESQHEKYRSPSYQIREGDSVNVDITSPGATLALGMMYFQTGNMSVSSWMNAPESQHLLDFVRPDFLLLRMVSKGLIMWDEVIPCKEWVEKHVPATIRKHYLIKSGDVNNDIDFESMNQAYCNILAGCCLAMGLRFAGSANCDAFNTLLHYCNLFISFGGKPIAEMAGRSTIESCLNVILLSLALVMSGTGNLETLRLCRFLRSRVGVTNSVVTYGSHMAIHMAMGFLFLGGGRYTLCTTPTAIAALLCALFPKFPVHSNDNRYHLQAFRHLYVLAVECRLFIPRSLDSGSFCYANIRVVYLKTKWYSEQEVTLMAPCMLPELHMLKEVSVCDENYWVITFHHNKNWDHLIELLKNRHCVGVKRKGVHYVGKHAVPPPLLPKSVMDQNIAAWFLKAPLPYPQLDPSLLLLCNLFLSHAPNDTAESFHLKELASHSVMAERSHFLTQGAAIVQALQSLTRPRSNTCVSSLVWQLNILDCASNQSVSVSSSFSSFSRILVQQGFMQLEKCGGDIVPLLKKYLNGDNISANHSSVQLATCLIFHNIPACLFTIHELPMKEDPVWLIRCLERKQHLQRESASYLITLLTS